MARSHDTQLALIGNPSGSGTYNISPTPSDRHITIFLVLPFHRYFKLYLERNLNELLLQESDFHYDVWKRYADFLRNKFSLFKYG